MKITRKRVETKTVSEQWILRKLMWDGSPEPPDTEIDQAINGEDVISLIESDEDLKSSVQRYARSALEARVAELTAENERLAKERDEAFASAMTDRAALARLTRERADVDALLVAAEERLAVAETHETHSRDARHLAEQERDSLRAKLAEVERERDCPEYDGTDAAHPAWWRGERHGADFTATALHRVAERGRVGTFGSDDMERAATAIDSLRAQVEAMGKVVESVRVYWISWSGGVGNRNTNREALFREFEAFQDASRSATAAHAKSTLDVATLRWAADYIERDRKNFAACRSRDASFLAALGEVVVTLSASAERVARGEDPRPSTPLGEATASAKEPGKPRRAFADIVSDAAIPASTVEPSRFDEGGEWHTADISLRGGVAVASTSEPSRSATASHAETGEKATPGFMGYPATYREPSRSDGGKADDVSARRAADNARNAAKHWEDIADGQRSALCALLNIPSDDPFGNVERDIENIVKALPPGPGTVVERVRAVCEEREALEALEAYSVRTGYLPFWTEGRRELRCFRRAHGDSPGMYYSGANHVALARAMGLVKDAP